jgi:hypothetical protein
MIIRPLLTVALLLAPTFSHADVLKCKVDGFKENIFITTAPDTNSNDGKYARIGRSPGIGNRAILVADPEGATAFVELNADGAPLGMVRVQPDMRVIKTGHTIDRSGLLFAPSKNAGVCVRCPGKRVCPA